MEFETARMTGASMSISFRTRLLVNSATYIDPSEAIVRAAGSLNVEIDPLSSLSLATPVPANATKI